MEINGETLGPFGILDDDFLEPLEAALVHIRIATNQKINEVQEVVDAMEEAGVEDADGYAFDLPDDAFNAVYAKAIEAATSGNDEDGICDPFFTFLEDQKYERESARW